MKFDWSLAAPAAGGAAGQGGGANPPATPPAIRDVSPEAIRAAVEAVIGSKEFGDQFQTSSRSQLELLVQEQLKGGTFVDRRFLNHPEAAQDYMRGAYGQGGAGGYGAVDPSYRFTKRDALDKTGWHNPYVRAQRTEFMGGWLRAVMLQGVHGKSRAHIKEIFADNMGFEPDDELVRVLATDDEDGGATLVPQGFIPELIKDAPRMSAIYQYVAKIPVSVPLGKMPITGAAARVFWGEEGEALLRSEPSFGKVEWALKRAGAFAEFTRELIADAQSNPEVVSQVQSMFGDALAREYDKVICIGNGTDRPLGIYSAQGITTLAVTDLDYETLTKLKHSVNIRYHGSAGFRWIMNQNVYTAILLIRDDNGNPIFTDAKGTEPAKILNVPFSIVNDCPNNFICIGDMKYYLWFDRGSLAMERSTEAGDAFFTHTMLMKLVTRVDGKPAIPPTCPFARIRTLQTVQGEAIPDLENQDNS